MLVLYETSLGYALFKADKNLDPATAGSDFAADPDAASNLVKLESIHRFQSTVDAVEDLSSIADGKLSKNLKSFLQESVKDNKKLAKETLLVADNKLGGAISKKMDIKVISDSTTQDVFRGIRQQLSHLLGDAIDESDLTTMALGLSHSLSRYKLKFSPDKVDTMVVQAIALLDDLDKEINIYAMRVKEWYGWHFPELSKILTDSQAYAKVILHMGFRTNAAHTDFSAILPEELEDTIKAIAQTSMGTEISITDLTHINLLAEQVVSLSKYRAELFDYLKNRMDALAPNITSLVGDMVGARLIAHAGSVLSLAKSPASTIQILGAEKALFRALKTKHDTPKYGLLFHASLVNGAPSQLKGKMARMLAGKTALSARLDALADDESRSAEDSAKVGIESKAKLESRLRQLELGMGIQSNRRESRPTNQKFDMCNNNNNNANGGYNPAADILMPTQPAAALAEANGVKKPAIEVIGESEANGDKKDKKKKRKSEGAADQSMEVDGEAASSSKKDKKEKKKAKAAEADGDASMAVSEADATMDGEDKAAKKERKKQKKLAKEQAAAAGEESTSKSKKRKASEQDGGDADTSAAAPAPAEDGSEKKKKKKSKKSDE